MEKGHEVPAFPDEIQVEKLIDAALHEAYQEYKEAYDEDAKTKRAS